MFEFLIVLTTAIVLVMYLGCVAAAVMLIRKGQMQASAGFGLVLALAALYSPVWLCILIIQNVPDPNFLGELCVCVMGQNAKIKKKKNS